MINPMVKVGDTIYGGASGVPTKLNGNTSTAVKFLSQNGDGVFTANAPAWNQPTFAGCSDVSFPSGPASLDLLYYNATLSKWQNALPYFFWPATAFVPIAQSTFGSTGPFVVDYTNSWKNDTQGRIALPSSGSANAFYLYGPGTFFVECTLGVSGTAGWCNYYFTDPATNNVIGGSWNGLGFIQNSTSNNFADWGTGKPAYMKLTLASGANQAVRLYCGQVGGGNNITVSAGGYYSVIKIQQIGWT